MISKKKKKEYSKKGDEEKNNSIMEIKPMEKKPLVAQKIEVFNNKLKTEPMIQIQELNGLQIINRKRIKLGSKRKTLFTQKIISFSLKSDEKIMKIMFISYDESIYYSVICKKTDIFSKIETLLYDRYPEYKNYNTYFIANGNIINKNRSLEDNKINSGDIITFKI